MSVANPTAVDVRRLLIHSRPRFWLYLAGPVAVGIVYGATGPGALASVTVIILLAYFLVPANVFLYGVNDIFDADLDRRNPKKFDRERRWEGNRMVVGGVLLAGVLGLVTFAVTPLVAWPYLAGFFILGAAYSAPPLRFKTTPGFDSAANGLYILPGAAAYAALAGSHPPLAALLGGWVWAMGMHAFSAIPDVPPDRAAGVATTATVLGAAGTLWFCLMCWTVATISFAVLDVRLGAILAVYPLVAGWILVRAIPVRAAYWWFPVLNGVVGMIITVGGLWRLTGGVVFG